MSSLRIFSHNSRGSLSRRRAFSSSLASRPSLVAFFLERGLEVEDPFRFAIFFLFDEVATEKTVSPLQVFEDMACLVGEMRRERDTHTEK